MTPTAQVRAAINADRAYADPALWLHRVPDDTLLARAAALEAVGPQDRPLWGVPVAVKDNTDVAGMPTTAACPDSAYTPAKDSPAVAALVRRAAAFVGAEPVPVAPFLALARLLYDGPWVAERTSALRPMLDRPASLHPTTRAILAGGLDRRTMDAFDAFHLQAQVRREAEALLSRFDALLVPTAPFCPTLEELEADPIGPNSRLGAYTNWVNLCGLCAIAVPAGMGPDGPAGVTVIGPAWAEGRIAALADTLHRAATGTVGATGMPLPPPAEPDPVGADEVALFCVGAHMAGLPLNGQVTALGGRFLREARTRPEYRLYALGPRPGLVRGGPGAIAGEVWALPSASVGPLLAQVAPPLGFGTAVLEDGPCLSFLAEAAGVEGEREITALGGWRAYLGQG